MRWFQIGDCDREEQIENTTLLKKQECIPIGCVPTTAMAIQIAPGQTLPRTDTPLLKFMLGYTHPFEQNDTRL